MVVGSNLQFIILKSLTHKILKSFALFTSDATEIFVDISSQSVSLHVSESFSSEFLVSISMSSIHIAGELGRAHSQPNKGAMWATGRVGIGAHRGRAATL